MVKEILAKLNQNEKLIGVGAIVVFVGWVFGLILTGSSGTYGGSFSWYGESGAMGTGFLALLFGVAAVVVIYLKSAPNMNITWPAPVSLILFIVAVLSVPAALLSLLQAFLYDPFGGLCSLYGVSGCPTKPILLYVAALAVLVGAGLMAFSAYREYTANKTAA
ncbi:MAG TPA: hypothetical protein VF337_09925 [Candidatus Limnocylindrales bacterium]